MKICIDPGHNASGVDTGAVGAIAKEQDITFGVADRLANILIQNGQEVIMTRESLESNVAGATVSSSLQNRADISNAFGANVFVSIHCNAGGGEGVETYIIARGGQAEQIARRVQDSMVQLGRRDRGVKVANLAVLRLTKAPAILVEIGFIDNPAEERWMIDHEEDIAVAIAAGLGFHKIDEWEGDGEMIYNYIDDNMPDWARPTIQKLVDKGYLRGNDNGELELTLDMLRMFVVNDRAGVYGD